MSCRDVSRLVSESLDRRLPAGQRLLVAGHLLICSACRRFRRQLVTLTAFLRGALAAGRDDALAARAELSPEARERMRRAIEREVG
jgi:predicted anti-sigma-YlaC factor YlaD